MDRTGETVRKERFEIRGHWLGLDDNSPVWRACWLDGRRVRRRSLGTADFEEAKVRLAEFAVSNTRPTEAPPQCLSIAEVLLYYRQDHADSKASADQARIAADHIASWWGLRKVSEITPATQREFILHLAAKGMAPATIRRNLSVLSAALRRAAKMGQLVAAPQILMAESDIAELVNAPGKIKERRLTIKELAAFLDAITTPHIWRYTVLALNTLARPDAITDLTPFQIRHGRIDLNPAGRRQNKKFRPIVPITPTLAGWLEAWEGTGSPLVRYKGKAVANVKKGIRETAIEAGLLKAEEYSPDRSVTPYTLRRSMARLLRAEGVSLADIGAMLGHKVPGFSTTEIYADADPNYLGAVLDGIESIMDEVVAHAKRAPVRVEMLPNCSPLAPHPHSKVNLWTGQNGRNPLVSQGVSVVGATRIELVTPTMSR